MQRGELVFGGVGAGLYGMLIFVVLTVFIAALMVGRTPELLRKKLDRRAVRIAILGILVLPFFALVLTAISISIVLPIATGLLNNAGPHGFSEMLYMFTSMTENDGSAFAGVSDNTYLNYVPTGAVMFCCRFLFIIPAVFIAGSLGGKRAVAETAGTSQRTRRSSSGCS
jgi:K+-transporting ATPase ATPase A chain